MCTWGPTQHTQHGHQHTAGASYAPLGMHHAQTASAPPGAVWGIGPTHKPTDWPVQILLDEDTYSEEEQVKVSNSYPGLLSKVIRLVRRALSLAQHATEACSSSPPVVWQAVCRGAVLRCHATKHSPALPCFPPHDDARLQYVCHRVTARVAGLPDGDFETVEKRADGLVTHKWKWL